ncbi:pseudouridine synthase [Pedosphaera parvula]|uniref:pseudouridine synthase n=1 Tax=Pedosphaera parvula TaxID=1032527 RepID=UPI0012379584|nr:pseudouridine synthase [Pedosphaera parvula]
MQKFLAEAGVASRRASERIILGGRVSVNGDTVRELGTKVDPIHDSIALDGAPLRLKRKLYVALNKPRGYVCSRKDDRKRKVIGDLLPAEWDNLYSVGRLDSDSEGLIFLTNDGEFSLHLTHPRYRVLKKYLATVEGRVEQEMLQRFKHGIVHEGEKLKVDRARTLSVQNSTSLVELELTEGKNREIRRLFESQGLTVSRLVRMQIGKIKLGELRSGKWRMLTEAEIKSLLSQ